MKTTIYEKKTTLKSLSKQDWKTVKAETEKKKLLVHISTNITELNELIYVGAKLLCAKIDVPPQEHELKLKTWMEN